MFLSCRTVANISANMGSKFGKFCTCSSVEALIAAERIKSSNAVLPWTSSWCTSARWESSKPMISEEQPNRVAAHSGGSQPWSMNGVAAASGSAAKTRLTSAALPKYKAFISGVGRLLAGVEGRPAGLPPTRRTTPRRGVLGGVVSCRGVVGESDLSDGRPELISWEACTSATSRWLGASAEGAELAIVLLPWKPDCPSESSSNGQLGMPGVM
mmetsp:Transcript_20386/g.51330  ORF Transcript_20386/g.51330 Transcript_20386/m.51330 type:complete len:213 (-) Transcript_20386:191-829(-)